MIKFILSNNEQYSHKYNRNIPIKEIVIDFCKKQGLLSDIYDVYDPVKFELLDTSKNLYFYDLRSILLKRVTNPSIHSLLDIQDKLSLEDSIDKSFTNYSVQAYSQNSNSVTTSNNEITVKKSKQSIISKLKHRILSKKSHYDRSFSESLATQCENKMFTSSTNQLYDDDAFENNSPKPFSEPNLNSGKKKKRNAPLPPCNLSSNSSSNIMLRLHFENKNNDTPKHIDLDLPLPPSNEIALSKNIDYFPWQTNEESQSYDNDSFIEEIIYSNLSLDPYSVSLSENNFIEPPLFPCDNDLDDRSHSPEHVYAKIKKKQQIEINENDSDNSSIDTPRIFKSKNIKSSNENEGIIIKSITNPNDIYPSLDNSNTELGNISAHSDYLNAFSISENHEFLYPPKLSTESNRSSSCSINSNEIYTTDCALKSHTCASNTPESVTLDTLNETKEEISKPLILNLERNIKSIPKLPLNDIDSSGDIIYSNNEGTFSINSLTAYRTPEQILPKEVRHTEKIHVNTIPNKVSDVKNSEEKSKIINVSGNINTFRPKLLPKPNCQQANGVSKDRSIHVEKKGGSLYFSVGPK